MIDRVRTSAIAAFTASTRAARPLRLWLGLWVLLAAMLCLAPGLHAQTQPPAYFTNLQALDYLPENIQLVPGGGGLSQLVQFDSHGNLYVGMWEGSSNTDGVSVVVEYPAGCSSYVCIITRVSSIPAGNYGLDAFTVDSSGNIYVFIEGESGRALFSYASNCTSASCATQVTASGLSYAAGDAVSLATDSNGNLFVGNRSNSTVYRILATCLPTATGSDCVTTLGGFAAGTLFATGGIATDAAGNAIVTLLLPGSTASSVVSIPPTCSDSSCMTTLYSNSYSNPNSILAETVAVDSTNGNIFTTSGNGVVELFAPDYTTNVLMYEFPPNQNTDSAIAAYGGHLVVMNPGVAAIGTSVGTATPTTPSLNVIDYNNQELPFSTTPVGSSAPTAVVLNIPADAGTGVNLNGVLTAAQAYQVYSGAVGSQQPVVSNEFSTLQNVAAPGTCPGSSEYAADGPASGSGENSACNIDLLFTPQLPGQRKGGVEAVDPNGNPLAVGLVSGTGVAPLMNFFPGTQSAVVSGLGAPGAVAADDNGNIFVADTGNKRILVQWANGQQAVVPSSLLSSPSAIAYDGFERLYVADSTTGDVLLESPPQPNTNSTSWSETLLLNGFSSPGGIAVDAHGNIYVADTGNDQVLLETPTAQINYPTNLYWNLVYIQSVVVSGLSSPEGIAVDAQGNVYIADTNNNRVLLETLTNGSYTQSVIASGLNAPTGVAANSPNDVYIADSLNNRVLKETLANGGSYTQSVIAQGLGAPGGVAIDGYGKVYVADTNNNQVLKEDFTNPASLNFVSTPMGEMSSDSPQTITVENIGNAPLNLPVLGTGRNPGIAEGGFVLDGATTCPQAGSSGSGATLAAGASCTLAVDFSPTASGSISGLLTLTDNNLNASAPNYAVQTINLSGTAQPPAAVTATTVVASAQLTYNTAASFTPVSGSGGTGTLSYSISPALSGGLSFNPSSGAITGTPAAPSAAASYMVTVSDSDNATAAASFALTVSQATPAVSTWPAATAINYGQALASSTLGTGTASVTGTFNWTTPATTPGVGTSSQSVTFTPADTIDYTSVSGSVPVTVNSAAGAASPVITSLSPALVQAGSAAFTLTVNGTNFASGATVLWKGSSRNTTFVSASQLTASITAEDIASAGTVNVTVVNSDGGISSNFVFAIDSAAGTPGNFTVSSAATVNVTPGQTTQLPVTLAGVASGATVTVSCVNLPAGATCTYSNGVVTISTTAGAAAGSYPVTVIFTVTQQTTTAMMHRIPVYLAAWFALPLGLLWVGEGRRKAVRRWLMVLFGLLLLMSLAGCGGSSSPTTSTSGGNSSTTTTQTSMEVTLTVS